MGSILNEPSVKSIQSVSKDQFKPCDSGNKGFILQNAVSHLRVTVISLVHITVKSVVYVRECTVLCLELSTGSLILMLHASLMQCNFQLVWHANIQQSILLLLYDVPG